MEKEQIEMFIKQSKKGNQEAFVKLMKQFEPVVLKMKKMYYVKDFDQEDWLQEGKIIGYQSVMNYDLLKGLSFGYYFKLNLERHIFSILRKQNAYKRQSDVQAISLDGKMAECGDTFLLEESAAYDCFAPIYMRDRIAEFYTQLSAFEARIFTLYIKKYSVQQIAEMLDCTELKVKSGLDRVRRKFKKSMI